VDVSVVIPSFNGATWLPLSVPKVDLALKRAKIKKAEIIVVDDGSTDNTKDVVKKIDTNFPLRIISQPNSGRFVARKTGTNAANYEHILFIDTRIYIAPNALKFVTEEIAKKPERQVWTSHVYLDKNSNMYARFWDAITSLAWRRYFSHPRDYSYGLKEFDHFPKGTTCFFVPKKIIKEANEWFTHNTKDLKTSNDDTLLIRHIAEKTNININPQFSCTYHARTSLKQYTRHVYHRGQVFVDGFLRRDGNRFYYPLITFLFLSILVPVVLILFPSIIVPTVMAGAVLWIVELILMLVLGVSLKDSMSVFVLSPLFAFAYGAGIWRAFYKLHIRSKVKK
jgi:glycosyltransferase involved in cell wall biosynthesis